MEKKKMEVQEIGIKDMDKVSGGTGIPGPGGPLLEMACKKHEWIDNRSICILPEGEFSEKKCIYCGTLKYFRGNTEISKEEFFKYYTA